MTVYVPNNHTRAWCRKTQFSGLRQDPILNNVEIWVMGKLAKEVSETARQFNPRAVEEAYAEVFGLDPNSVVLG